MSNVWNSEVSPAVLPPVPPGKALSSAVTNTTGTPCASAGSAMCILDVTTSRARSPMVRRFLNAHASLASREPLTAGSTFALSTNALFRARGGRALRSGTSTMTTRSRAAAEALILNVSVKHAEK
eukprot:CAMPEP_0185468460 /NCGR_PEP_ID=MMETSP1365-20130426/97743_1 /TAXON_ID=38817 /ORGANISM="Gephyrocapsa oceanica, Strain RCC1303" /LENGTH=124 /DNA_ID=CAMNT_0028075199 /DNA_START=1374 /DNA_END=1748 /DNA_ORIENTATION=+